MKLKTPIIMKLFFVCLVTLSCTLHSLAQVYRDSIKPINLEQVEIKDFSTKVITIEKLPEVYQTYIVSGKKNEVIKLENANVNLAEKTGRQIFAKIPGVFVYDMDGSGNQINIATRGLDPHRSWDFNLRQDGIMINSDIYGYPASHYSMPMEAISRIEIIRGTASLQYGAQYGGMVNYINKAPDTSRILGFENISTVGSYGLASIYNSVGGKTGKFTYFGYYANRKSDGYRKNSESKYDGELINLTYNASARFSIKAQVARSSYTYHIPGPLNDSMFSVNPTSSTRSRNYFNPEIWVPSVVLNYNLGQKTILELTGSAVLGERRSVQIEGVSTSLDAIDPITGKYKSRQVDIDGFNSYSTELRLKHAYDVYGKNAVFIGGVRLSDNDLKRRQVGVGSNGTDADFYAPDSTFKRNLSFRTQNIAFYFENLLKLTNKWSVSPGIRWENGISKMNGVLTYINAEDVPNEIKHNFVLLGVSSQYQVNVNTKLYGGIAQAYRPVIFKDIIPSSVLESTSKDLKDANGYNAELGISGSFMDKLTYNLTGFVVFMKNRLGAIAQTDSIGGVTILRTNIGDSRTNGLEAYIQLNVFHSNKMDLNIFTSTSYMNGRYERAVIRDGNTNKTIEGNKIESVPNWISRNGIEFNYKYFGFNILHSYTAETFSDPLNTTTPPANGTKGLVPSYNIFDAGCSYKLSNKFMIKINVNNLFNKSYFTKRPLFYPGAGIWPSDGRSIQLSVDSKF
jgi:Fe(3+) dicitrate transport protein